MQDLQQADATVKCRDTSEVDLAVQRFLKHPEELRSLHAHAATFMQDRSDVAYRMLKAIEPWLSESDGNTA
jgi:3-deoxy-D-manno-octulosonic-acid transferase